MASSSRYDNELESKISEISTYLNNLVTTGGETYTNSNRIPILGRKMPHNNFIPAGVSGPPSHPLNNFLPIPEMNPVPMSSACQLTNVTSALASRMNVPSSNLRFISPSTYPRSKKWVNSKLTEKEPDTSALDIDTTMAELGLTPDSLTSNEVYRLFSAYKKLAFYINASYVFDEIYDARTVPNTMNASVQTRHAVWSSNRVLRYLRETLRKYTYVPAEYHISLCQCKQSLEELHNAILKLDTFKYYDMEHRKNKFVSPGAEEILEPLIGTLNEVIECIGKSRMYVEVFVWSLNKTCDSAHEGAVGVTYEEPRQPVVMGESLGQPGKGRPLPARRFIG